MLINNLNHCFVGVDAMNRTFFHNSTQQTQHYFEEKMTSALAESMLSTSPNSTSCTTSNEYIKYRTALITIYSVVLLTGTISLSLMMHIIKTSSIISIAVLNLIFAHFIFLFTLPFRIYYYAAQSWGLNVWWCKLISAMIHIHMYMSFIFYVIILIMRLIMFYLRREKIGSFQRIHVLLASVVLWIMVLVAVPCVITNNYGNGNNNGSTDNTTCFKFGGSIGPITEVINYIISTVIIVVVAVLTALQANVLRVLYKKHHEGCTFQQDFGAQLKSMGFALIMVVCFIPYHMFRLYYLKHITEMQDVNEVFLSVTTFNCLDMLTFLGRRTCYRCFSGNT